METQAMKSQQDDNVIERRLDRNLFPMGPSPSDVFETGHDAGCFIADKSDKVFQAGDVLLDEAMDHGGALYQDGNDLYQDGIDTGREVIDDSLQALDAAKDAGTHFVGDRVDDVGSAVSSGLDKATCWN